ncbi:hypothetical protein SBI_07724 [Streptomyces bingchenggensis BCW-1]|uniref:Uncharacterized protein n=1 Tax=Streptomyces bingchenggensis (strain BCW-1) TaxID=749414 RepID=D7CCZ7_STRBB|nr:MULTISPECIES: hypothetical protein [Streptomyces]ADI10844.1 hypothetical protein SBI_07724 [Streptomyces bingchenggensis BCW-1]
MALRQPSSAIAFQGERAPIVTFYERAAEIVTSYEKSPIRNVPLWSEVVALEHPDQPWEEGDLDDIAGLEGEADLSEWQTWMLVGTRPFDQQPYSDFTFTMSHPAYLEHVVGGIALVDNPHRARLVG